MALWLHGRRKMEGWLITHCCRAELGSAGDEWAASMVLRSVDHAIQLGRKLGYVFGLCKPTAPDSCRLLTSEESDSLV